MRLITLILAWITPAVVAGVLGWKGVWGGNSAFFDYLIPVPLAGGVFHVPSFIVLVLVVFYAPKLPDFIFRYLAILAFSICLLFLSFQLDSERIYAWLFTDYSSASSVIKFGKNPLYLFVGFDAFWLGVYALLSGRSVSMKYWSFLVFVSIIAIGIQLILYVSNGPIFKIGGSSIARSDGKLVKGNNVFLVYTSANYQKQVFLNWLKEKNDYARPWKSPNYQHSAIFFTNSMARIKRRDFAGLNEETTIATICRYEEDKSTIAHKGYFDCFMGYETISQKINTLMNQYQTGLGKAVDSWYAQLILCKDVQFPTDYAGEVEIINVCRKLSRDHHRNVRKFINWYGEGSEQVRFIRAKAIDHGLK